MLIPILDDGNYNRNRMRSIGAKIYNFEQLIGYGSGLLTIEIVLELSATMGKLMVQTFIKQFENFLFLYINIYIWLIYNQKRINQ